MDRSSFVIHLFTSGVTDLNRVTPDIPHAPGIPARPLTLCQHTDFNGVPILKCLYILCMLLGLVHLFVDFLLAVFPTFGTLRCVRLQVHFSLGSAGSPIFSLFLG